MQLHNMMMHIRLGMAATARDGAQKGRGHAHVHVHVHVIRRTPISE